jgi:hypothetical protein
MERGGRAFLLPSDAQVSGDVALLEDTAINVETMRERIKQTGVKQVLIILDACRNDPMGRADAPNPLTKAYTKGFNFDVRNREVKAFATLYATAVGERAYEYKEKRQGYFTWALVEGLEGAAANEKGEVTLSRLVKYVQEAVPKRITIDLGLGKQQEPFAVVEGYKADELVIAITEKKGANSTAAVVQPFINKYPNGEFVELAKNKLNALIASAKPLSTTTNRRPISGTCCWSRCRPGLVRISRRAVCSHTCRRISNGIQQWRR